MTHQTKSHFASDCVPKWKKEDLVLCRHLTRNREIYYEAKIMKVTETHHGPIYSIHYQGWNSRHDERISQANALLRFKEYTKEAAENEKAKAKEESLTLRRRKSSLKAKRLRMKRKTSFQASEMMKENSNKINGSIQMQQIRVERSPNEMNAAKFMRLSAPPPLKQSTIFKANVTKVIAPDASDSDTANGRSEVQLSAALLQILVEDEKMVTKRKSLPRLPARITVFDIFQKYREEIEPNNSFADHPSESALGLLDYFETTIGRMLLYSFEWQMFSVLERTSDVENTVVTNDGVRILYSKQFGFPHLVRMFVRFSEMLSYSEWTKQTYDAVILRAQHFLTFLDKNRKQFCDFEKDYFAAPSEYLENFHKTSALNETAIE